MTEANYTHGNAEVQSIHQGPPRVADAAGLLAFFIGRTDLEFLSEASEQAAGDAATLSRVVSGIGCLISEEQMSAGTKSGALQDSDLPGLLWFVSSQIDTIGQMAYIGSEADYRLRMRAQEVAACKKGANRG
ncbi:hypothetical protein [Burkholderia sp. LMG 13014]|uniref:hypothetical protein n=1 Tax=Burkholderia sp. LMG 13014 TaxID=2709306 RepID=UPI001F056282|nr:hypothetical protein [Burkholderia sp. LMG 13014]